GYAGRPLFEDQRPRNIGDILTIVISENVAATKSSGADTSRQSGTSFSSPTSGFLSGFFGKANLSAQGANTFAATGGANASNTFNGVLTVTVTNVLPNGNLVVSGQKQMLINQGMEFVRFSGVVNPNTVAGDNSVLSTEVADAKIEYSAKGVIDEAETMGWLQRFFLNLAPW
ncbi:MAG TPA: flagellar basal body L-ring protein FlgH, partial [Paraburkholderia sp.]